jgi:hypothetical protein
VLPHRKRGLRGCERKTIAAVAAVIAVGVPIEASLTEVPFVVDEAGIVVLGRGGVCLQGELWDVPVVFRGVRLGFCAFGAGQDEPGLVGQDYGLGPVA